MCRESRSPGSHAGTGEVKRFRKYILVCILWGMLAIIRYNLLSKKLKIKIYRTIILPVVLYGCETWSLTLRDERRLRVFEIGC